MKPTIKLLKDWLHEATGETFAAGTVLEVDGEAITKEIAQGLVFDGTAERCSAGKAPEPQYDAAALAAEVRAAVAEAMKSELPKPPAVPKDTEAEKKGGFANFAEFALGVAGIAQRQMNRESVRKLQAWHEKTASESVDSAGGFLVPEEFAAQLLERVRNASLIINSATPVPMGSNAIKYPAVHDFNESGHDVAGMEAYWTAEGSAPTASTPNFGQVRLEVNDLIGLAHVTNDLIQDSAISIPSVITSLFTQAVMHALQRAMIEGTGAGQPLGILNAPCLVTVAKRGGQLADTVVYGNIVDMWSRMPGELRSTAMWNYNQDIEPKLLEMALNVGTGGSAVWLPGAGASASPYATLMGRPCLPLPYCSTLGDLGDIFFCCWSQYLLGQRGATTIAESIHLKFDESKTSYRITVRADGKPWWNTYITPENGTNYMSPFVTLAERA